MKPELEKLTDGTDILNFIRVQKIAWIGHLERMHENRCANRIFQWKPEGQRTDGRLRKSWMDDVLEDLNLKKLMRIRNWNSIVKQSKAHR